MKQGGKWQTHMSARVLVTDVLCGELRPAKQTAGVTLPASGSEEGRERNQPSQIKIYSPQAKSSPIEFRRSQLKSTFNNTGGRLRASAINIRNVP